MFWEAGKLRESWYREPVRPHRDGPLRGFEAVVATDFIIAEDRRLTVE